LSKEIAGFFAYQELRKIRREVIAQRKEAERQAKAEKEKFQEDVNTILIILTLIFICAVGAYFALHLSGRI
jgi:CHASE3 domain sensor protein